MPNFVIGADRVTKLMGVAIIALGGVVWADLRWQSMRAANEATEAATAAIKALDEIKEITVQHEYRLRSLDDRVSLLEGRNRLQGPRSRGAWAARNETCQGRHTTSRRCLTRPRNRSGGTRQSRLTSR